MAASLVAYTDKEEHTFSGKHGQALAELPDVESAA